MPQQINHTQVPLNYRKYADQYKVSWIDKKDEKKKKKNNAQGCPQSNVGPNAQLMICFSFSNRTDELKF